MKSKIKFDLTEQNDPCIIAEISHDTEDLRDKVAKRFIEELGYESNTLRITFIPSDNTIDKCLITPVSKITISDQYQIVLEFIRRELQNKLDCKDMKHLVVDFNSYFEVDSNQLMYQAYLYNPNNMHWKDGYYITHNELSLVISEISGFVNSEIKDPKLKK